MNIFSRDEFCVQKELFNILKLHRNYYKKLTIKNFLSLYHFFKNKYFYNTRYIYIYKYKI